MEGLLRVGLSNQSALISKVGINILTPELLAHDPVNGELFWVEQDIEKGAAQIYRHVVTVGDSSLAVEVHFNESRPGSQGKQKLPPREGDAVQVVNSTVLTQFIFCIFGAAIQAMDLDWMHRNVYFAIERERRIRVCQHNSSLCTEILGSDVSDSVCDIKLFPQIRCC